MNRLLRAILWAAVAIGAGACTVKVEPAIHDARALEGASCRALYPMLDARVAQAGVADAQFARIDGYPYLRINRFLASDDIKPEPGGDGFDAWVERLRQMDWDARRIELKNLPRDGEDAPGAGIAGRLEECSALLVSADLTTTAVRLQLLASARVFDNHSVNKRVFGLYPLTSLAFKAGVINLHESMRADFSRSLDALAVAGRLTRYRPPPGAVAVSVHPVASLVAAAAADPLGIPALSPAELRRLFDTFAPIYEIDVLSDDDRIGTVFWSGDEMPSVDVSRPVVYRRVSYTRFEGRTLLQLNYSVWFPSRPSEGSFDLLSGRLDGITFRVTLDRDARPLIYDSMHNCGCYHLFLPTGRLTGKPPSGAHEEPPLVAQHVAWEKGRVVLRIAHGSHYLQRLYFDTGAGEGARYVLDDDDSLRSLPLADGVCPRSRPAEDHCGRSCTPAGRR